MWIEVVAAPSSPSSLHIVLFTNHIPGLAVSFEVEALLEGLEVRVGWWVGWWGMEGQREGWRGWELVLSQTLGWINKPGNIKSPFPLHLWTCALDCVNIHQHIWTQLVLTLCYTLLCSSSSATAALPTLCAVQRVRNESDTEIFFCEMKLCASLLSVHKKEKKSAMIIKTKQTAA